ncbi:Phosphorylated adapter RNA export protein [Echinococcus granulosus]|uniref:Phosphorylated adapter RNA export protein n=1 Tax=Echinococcus granulosus TaxID=6210 RepID=W6U6D4_ECHGR|nr:Phosphorylated adapter RNA export protein [Echinococcus granulosus]EUB56788.1 Phosphorylated adapter RNA export protein [Echinococcus granulosus]
MHEGICFLRWDIRTVGVFGIYEGVVKNKGSHPVDTMYEVASGCILGALQLAEMKTRDISSGEVSSISSDDEELPMKALCRHSPEQVRPSKGVRNRVWQSVVLENTLENAFKSTALESDKLTMVNRGAESYRFDENEVVVEPVASMEQRPPSRKRRLSERLAPRSYDRTIPRDHYGVNFDSSSDEAVSAIANFLEEDREDLIGRIVKTIGVKRALEFCYLTEDIEKCGGLCTMDGTRRRTPGGVFFVLIRRSDQVSKDEKKIIFKETSVTKLFKKRLRQSHRRRAAASQAQEQPPDCEATVDFKDLPSPDVYIEYPVASLVAILLHGSGVYVCEILLRPADCDSDVDTQFTLPGERVLIPGASAYLMTVGKVVDDTAMVSFTFDTPPESPALLYSFRHFNLPQLSFNTREFCANLLCGLYDSEGNKISDIVSTCFDNANPDLYGPVVFVPKATNVTCSVIWYYPREKSHLNGSVQIIFASAYNGKCEDAYSTWVNSSSWCNVNLKNLKDTGYEDTQQLLCLERTVAVEAFNTTCSDSMEPPVFHFPLAYVIISICTLVFLLIVLILISCCICKRIKRRKIRKLKKTGKLQTNGGLIHATPGEEEGALLPGEQVADVVPDGGKDASPSDGQRPNETSEGEKDASFTTVFGLSIKRGLVLNAVIVWRQCGTMPTSWSGVWEVDLVGGRATPSTLVCSLYVIVFDIGVIPADAD